MSAVEEYVTELEAALRLRPGPRARLVAEVREHLDDAVEHHLAAGRPRDEAEEQAVAAFGPVATIVGPAHAAAGTIAMRRAPLVALVAGVAAVGGLVLAARGSSTMATVTGARLVVGQLTFFAGVIALELAFVAGACGAARAAALWHRAEAPVADRRFVLGATARSISCTLVAVVLWAATILDGGRPAHGWGDPALVGALLAMVGGAVVAHLVRRRLRANLTDEASGAAAVAGSGPAVLGLGEHALTVVRRHGALACSLVAAVAAAGAMAHAETTFRTALPWGAAQAAAVAVGFVVLGPQLGLRDRPDARHRPGT
jgi:hypothetical protein